LCFTARQAVVAARGAVSAAHAALLLVPLLVGASFYVSYWGLAMGDEPPAEADFDGTLHLAYGAAFALVFLLVRRMQRAEEGRASGARDGRGAEAAARSAAAVVVSSAAGGFPVPRGGADADVEAESVGASDAPLHQRRAGKRGGAEGAEGGRERDVETGEEEGALEEEGAGRGKRRSRRRSRGGDSDDADGEGEDGGGGADSAESGVGGGSSPPKASRRSRGRKGD